MASSYAISALTAIATFNTGDLLVMVDVTDFTQAPTGTTKKGTIAQFTSFIFANPTFTGNVTAANINAGGLVTAALFSGAGSSLTQLNATQLTSGTVPSARVSGSYTGITALGTIAALAAGTGAFSSNVTIGGTLGVTGAVTVGGQGIFTGNVSGAGSATFGGTVRSTGTSVPTTGAGAEIHYGTFADFLGFDRDASTFLPVRVLGSTLSFLIGNGPTGLTIAGTGAATFTNAVTVSTGGLTVSAGATALTTLAASGLSTLTKIKGGGSAPTGSSVGGGPVVMTGTDTAGLLTWTPNATYTAQNLVVTFSAAFATVPYVNITLGTATNSLNPPMVYVSAISTTGFTVNLLGTITGDFQNAVPYKVYYQVIA